MTTSVSKAEKERAKLMQERCQFYLTDLLKDDDNKYCVDCDAKGPRWASWNLGVFLCIRCAGIHRNLGVHISKVKSINLDSWTPEQIGYLQQMGNSKARAVFEANLPDNFRRPQADSALEAFIRSKYEQRKYIAKEWVQPPTPPPAFDVEEERKKEKERKKQKPVAIVKNPSTGSASDSQTSSVPRPPCNSAGTEISADKVKASSPTTSNGKVKNGESDLLGLSFGSPAAVPTVKLPLDQDPFQNLSSSGISPPESKTTSTLGDEESDFFNQKVPEKKMDKDSILKMFDSNTINPPNNNNAFFNPVSAAPVPGVFSGITPFSGNSIGNPIGNPIPANNMFGNTGVMPCIPQPQQQHFMPQTSIASGTNPFLASTPAAVTPLVPLNHSAVNNNNIVEMQQQLGSLNINSGLVSNWLSSTPGFNGGALSSMGPSSLDKINPFAGTTGLSCTPALSSLTSNSVNSVANNPLTQQTQPQENSTQQQNLFADFASFPSASVTSMAPAAQGPGSTQVNWGLTSNILNPLAASASSSLPSSDLWQ